MEYKEIDFEGEETLRAISEASNFNEWMYNSIKPFCKGKILEIGSGIGNISSYFIDDKKDITLSDIREQYRKFLKNSKKTMLAKCIDMGVVDDEFEIKHQALLGTYDTVFALNVLEHIKDDNRAIENMLKLLKENGRLVILVPAYNFLYNSFDKELMHYRRYTKATLSKIMAKENTKVENTFYFNLFGIFGWLVVGSILQKKIIPSENMRLFNLLVPVFKLLDTLCFNKLGLSVICVAAKCRI